jgi:hypothetical protein
MMIATPLILQFVLTALFNTTRVSTFIHKSQQWDTGNCKNRYFYGYKKQKQIEIPVLKTHLSAGSCILFVWLKNPLITCPASVLKTPFVIYLPIWYLLCKQVFLWV